MKWLRNLIGAATAVVLLCGATYTPNKGIPEPAVGDDSNAWGTLLNQGAVIIDSALGGVADVSVAGNADVTATALQAQNFEQRLSGALTGNIHYILPPNGSFYVVSNKTSGAFTVTVITSAGGSTGQVVPQGSRLALYSNGTNILPMTGTDTGGITATGDSSISGMLAIGGPLFANGGIQTTTFTATSAATAPPGTAGSQLVNFGQFGASLAATGYQQLPDGLIIQWGQANVFVSNPGTITFPRAFPHAYFSSSILTGIAGSYVIRVVSESPSSIGYSWDNWGTVGAGNLEPIRWIAIGY